MNCPAARHPVHRATLLAASLLVSLFAGCASFQSESGFIHLFDGRTLNGWQLVGGKGGGYGVTNGVIYCAKGGGGNLFHEREFEDFILRLEFKLEDGSNNGIGIRAPLATDVSSSGMEIQILEEGAALRGKWGPLREAQYHGSVYDCIPARRGALKPPGQWNTQEITARGRRITVVLNGQTILDADLNTVTDPEKIRKHPGLFRERGHIGFLGHNDYLEFRNIRVKPLPRAERANTPPPGFIALFNGRNLDGWQGLLKPPLDNPLKRAALSADARAAAQREADENMRAHWKAEDGTLVFDGQGRSLCTARDFANFELQVDWKIPPHGDSGIYLRGSPQVQIWDPFTLPRKSASEVGSGGLFNNQTNRSQPLLVADKPVGEWNRFRILMVGERVHVFLNGQLVTRDTVLENYWDRSRPIFSTGPIELQNHGDQLWFKNIYLRELPAR
jgi:hypothetical protein